MNSEFSYNLLGAKHSVRNGKYVEHKLESVVFTVQ